MINQDGRDIPLCKASSVNLITGYPPHSVPDGMPASCILCIVCLQPIVIQEGETLLCVANVFVVLSNCERHAVNLDTRRGSFFRPTLWPKYEIQAKFWPTF